jgi:O-antigen/teichoic acid export membrane protein
MRARGETSGFDRTLGRGLAVVALALGAFAAVLAAGGIVSSAVASNFPLVVAATAGLVVQNVAVSLFAASLRPRAYATVEVSARVGGIGLGVALVFAGYGVHGYLAGLATASLLIGLVGLRFAWPRDASASLAPPALTPWLRYGVPASMAAVLVWALTFVDRYILALFENAGAVGIYTMGNALGDRLVMVPMFAFAAAATPLLVTAFETHGRAEVERLMTAYTRIILLLALPCVAYVAAAGSDLVTAIAGINYFRYGTAATVAPIIACGSVLFALAGLANTGLAVAKRTKYLAASSAIGLAANVAANVVLIPLLGIVGAAIATPLANALYLGATYRWARDHATWHFPWGTFVRAAAAAGAGYATAALVTFGAQPIERAAFAALIGAAAYLVSLLLLGERRHRAAA